MSEFFTGRFIIVFLSLVVDTFISFVCSTYYLAHGDKVSDLIKGLTGNAVSAISIGAYILYDIRTPSFDYVWFAAIFLFFVIGATLTGLYDFMDKNKVKHEKE